MTKKNEDEYIFFQDWVNFFYSKQSVFIKQLDSDKYIPLSYGEVLNSFNNKKDRSNLYFSINWYKYLSKTREAKYIEKLNCFYFDIDMKDNNRYSKIEIKSILDKFDDQYDILIESRNGFHIYIILEEWKYNKKDKDKYISDWKNKWEELELLLWIKFDSKIYDITRISRLPLSNHFKKKDTDYFEIKFIKWKEIISPLRLRENKINDIDIELVINKLYDEKLNDIYIYNNKIYRWNEESSWLKINKEKNYINDFSRKYFKWNNFDIVRDIFYKRLKDEIKDKNKLYSESLIKTFSFFAKYFWIISINELKFNIIISAKIQEVLNNIYLTWYELKYFLWLLNFSQWKENKINYYWKTQKIEILKFNDYNWIIWSVSKSKKIFDLLSNNKDIKEILDLKVIKEKKKLFIVFTILPWYFNYDKKKKNMYYWNHFIDKKILDNTIKKDYFKFLFKIIRKVVCYKNINEYSVNHNNIRKEFNDSNLQRVKKGIKDISDFLWLFNMNLIWKEIIFKKK